MGFLAETKDSAMAGLVQNIFDMSVKFPASVGGCGFVPGLELYLFEFKLQLYGEINHLEESCTQL